MILSFSFSLTNTFKYTLSLLSLALVSVSLLTNPVVAQNDDIFDCPVETWPSSLIKARDELHKAVARAPHVTVQLKGTKVTLNGSLYVDSPEPTQETLKTLKVGLVPSWGIMSSYPSIDENFQVRLMVPFILSLGDRPIEDLVRASAHCTITPETPVIRYTADNLAPLNGGTYHMSSAEGTSSFSVICKSILLKDPRLRIKTKLFIFEARKFKAALSTSKLEQKDDSAGKVEQKRSAPTKPKKEATRSPSSDKTEKDLRKQIKTFKEKLRAFRERRTHQQHKEPLL